MTVIFGLHVPSWMKYNIDNKCEMSEASTKDSRTTTVLKILYDLAH